MFTRKKPLPTFGAVLKAAVATREVRLRLEPKDDVALRVAEVSYVKTKLLAQLGMRDEALDFMPGGDNDYRKALARELAIARGIPNPTTEDMALQVRTANAVVEAVDQTIEGLVPAQGAAR